MKDNKIYTAKILRTGSVKEETISILSYWDETLTKDENYQKVINENLIAKSSRTRVKYVIKTFEERYGKDVDLLRALIYFVKNNISSDAIDKLLFYYTARSDPLVKDFFVNVIYEWYNSGRKEITPSEVDTVLNEWSKKGRTSSPWSPTTRLKLARSLLATYRDFGALEGKAKKYITPSLLPISAFSFITFQLHFDGLSGKAIQMTDVWKLFLLDNLAVERFLLESHQNDLLHYEAAGKIVRLEFPQKTHQEYAKHVYEKLKR